MKAKQIRGAVLLLVGLAGLAMSTACFFRVREDHRWEGRREGPPMGWHEHERP
jgi:Co/Zn/Cd efflux system component